LPTSTKLLIKTGVLDPFAFFQELSYAIRARSGCSGSRCFRRSLPWRTVGLLTAADKACIDGTTAPGKKDLKGHSLS